MAWRIGDLFYSGADGSGAAYVRNMRWVSLVVGFVVASALCATAGAESRSNTIVVVDPSMAPEKLSVVTISLTTALAEIHPDDQIAVIAAGTTATTPVPMQRVGDGKQLTAALDKVRWAKRGNVRGGLRAAASLVAKLPKESRRVDTRVLVITDAETLPDVEKQVAALSGVGVRVSALSYQGSNRLALGRLTALGGEGLVAGTKEDVVDAVIGETSLGANGKPVAMVLLIDRSASTQGSRLEAAKEAARVTVEILAPTDSIAVIAFDTEAREVVPMQRANNKMRISTDISKLTSGGGTSFYPALQAASDALSGLGRVHKHVVLVTDGESPADGIADLVAAMHAAHIVVSAVGLQGADRALLTTIADQGGGRLYMVEDLASLPKIFMRETRTSH
jgi:uncharacterized protein YegL